MRSVGCLARLADLSLATVQKLDIGGIASSLPGHLSVGKGVNATDLGIGATEQGNNATDDGNDATDLAIDATELGTVATDLANDAIELGIDPSEIWTFTWTSEIDTDPPPRAMP